ncbi:MAG: methyltransferase domain-containing protein [Acidimicrobiales bacterium]
MRWGSLRSVEPVSRWFGFDRGTPVDRWYIDQFLSSHAEDVRGRVLEIGDSTYTRAFGGERVAQADVLHIHADNPEADFVGDLADGSFLPSDAFDCLLITQTLQYVYDLRAAVATLHRILKPGGVALVTCPGIAHTGADEWRDMWQWTVRPNAAQRLFRDEFGDDVELSVFGNVLTTISFLEGIAAEELTTAELEQADPQYPMLVCVRAVKRADG